MTPREFTVLREFLKNRSGIVLTADKEYFVEARLSPLLREQKIENLSQLISQLKLPCRDELKNLVVEALTVNESFFFRDQAPFQNFVESMIPHILESRDKNNPIGIWSAAASSGQEIYSLAILIREHAELLKGRAIKLLATDLSIEILQKAKSGIYSQFEVQRGMPASYLIKYFKQTGGLWQIDSALRRMVQFKPFNLLDDFTILGCFDIVFCRNVLIYFDRETKKNILERMCQQMNPDSFLVLGASEAIVGITEAFIPIKGVKGIYQVNPDYSIKPNAFENQLAQVPKLRNKGVVRLKSA